MDPVAPPLRDRMEVIELPGYTTSEKLEIARRYLVRRQSDENGLTGREITISEPALRRLIEAYTRESGVRNLERAIGTVLRGVAAKVAREEDVRSSISIKDLETYLGPPRFDRDVALHRGVPGVVTGLAYTPVGGEIIFVEAAQMPGKGGFTLTGQIGDVMRESGIAALSLVRARAADWHINHEHLQQTDIHIHVPAGGVPKDGPSAGVAMLPALVSLLSGRPADPKVAMPGEITLRGQVLPIGGVKEKVLAAHRAGVKTVVLPARNKHDLHDVPGDVREELKFVLATRVEEVLAAALGPATGTSGGSHPTKGRKPRRAARKAVRPPVRKGPARAAAGV
jgi:ATP-dependent Lon protease